MAGKGKAEEADREREKKLLVTCTLAGHFPSAHEVVFSLLSGRISGRVRGSRRGHRMKGMYLSANREGLGEPVAGRGWAAQCSMGLLVSRTWNCDVCLHIQDVPHLYTCLQKSERRTDCTMEKWKETESRLKGDNDGGGHAVCLHFSVCL